MSSHDPLQLSIDGAGMKRQTVRGAGATAAAQGVKFCLQFACQIALARMLDPAQFGLVAMVAPVLGLVLTLNNFGIDQAIIQRSDITQAQVSALFWLNLAIGAGMTLLAMLSAPWIAWMYGEPRTVGITLASAVLILLTSLAAVPMALLNRQLRLVTLAVIEVVAMVLGLASGLLSAWQGAGYWSLVIMQATHSTVALVLAWANCHWRPNWPAMVPGVGTLMRFGINVMGSNLAAHLSASADNVIVGIVNGKVALGLYDRSYNLVVKPLSQLMAPAGRVAIPLLSRLQDTPQRYVRVYLLIVQLSTALCVPGLIAIIVAARPLIEMLLGPKWMAMVPVFAWIAFGGMASVLSASTYWLFTTQNRTHEQLRFGSLAALISIAAFGLGSLWGVVGVAMAAALSFMFVQTPLLVWAATRRGPVTLALVANSLWPLLAAGSAAAAACVAALRFTIAPDWALVLLSFFVSYGVFAAALLVQPAGRALAARARGLLLHPAAEPTP